MSNQYRALADEIIERVTNRDDFIAGRMTATPTAGTVETLVNNGQDDGAAAMAGE